jgi:hypothetical protein
MTRCGARIGAEPDLEHYKTSGILAARKQPWRFPSPVASWRRDHLRTEPIMFLLAALSASLSLWADAPAAAVPSTTAAPATFEDKQKAKMKCEKIVLIGSRMPKRVCRTPEQIKQSEQDAKDMTVEFQKINPEQLSK